MTPEGYRDAFTNQKLQIANAAIEKAERHYVIIQLLTAAALFVLTVHYLA